MSLIKLPLLSISEKATTHTNFTDAGTGGMTSSGATCDTSFARQWHRCFGIILLRVVVLFINDFPFYVDGFVVGTEQPSNFVLDVWLIRILRYKGFHIAVSLSSIKKTSSLSTLYQLKLKHAISHKFKNSAFVIACKGNLKCAMLLLGTNRVLSPSSGPLSMNNLPELLYTK